MSGWTTWNKHKGDNDMASIVKRGNGKYSVVYYYTTRKGEKKQRWESFNSYQDARKRKSQVEYETSAGILVPKSTQTIKSFLEDFVSLYGERNWVMSTYEANTGLINNYVNPLIGEVAVKDLQPMMIEEYYKKLSTTKSLKRQAKGAKAGYVTHTNIGRIHQLLKCAFKQAVRWDMIPRNPYVDFKRKSTSRAISGTPIRSGKHWTHARTAGYTLR